MLGEVFFWTWYRAAGRGEVAQRIRLLERLERHSREQLDDLVRRRLALLLRHAIRTVPHYGRVAESVRLRDDEGSIEKELRRLPILTKRDLQADYNLLASRQRRRHVYANTSGGSTGQPARFLQDRDYQNWGFGNKLRFFTWTGYRPGDGHLKIWGAPRDLHPEMASFRARVRSFALNSHVVDCHRMEPDTWQQCLATMKQRQPAVIEGYVDGMRDFAQFLEQNAGDVPSPMGLVTSAGVLSEDLKARLASIFRCPVLNRYGSREVGDIACSCLDSDALHISELTHHVEVVDDGGNPCEPGQEGDVLITLLTNYTMPLIRYRIEDRAVFSDVRCPCGRTTRTLKAVTGRSIDYLLSTSGSRINGTALTTFLYGLEGVRRYQLHQQADGVVNLKILPLLTADRARLGEQAKRASESLMRALGEGSVVRPSIVSDLPLTPTGKHRYILRDRALVQGRS